MSGDWYTDPGATGELRVRREDGEWYVDAPEVEGRTRVLFEGDDPPSASTPADDPPVEIEVTVSKHAIGGSGPDYLFVSRETGGTSPESADRGSPGRSPDADEVDGTTESTDPERRYPERSLSELEGSGERVTVEAVVDSVYWVRKGDSGVPDLKGGLVDESVPEAVAFVVRDGVAHPYLGEGDRFRFVGACDHYYDRDDQVQVAIDDRTDIEHTGSGPTRPSVSTDPPDHVRVDPGAGGRTDRGSQLDEIAESELGDHEFTVREDDESVVGRARRRARRRDRDPAIDPKLRPDESDDGNETTDGS